MNPDGLGLLVGDLGGMAEGDGRSDGRGWRVVSQLAADAEAAGATAFWLTDHLYWHRPTVEVLAALALAATATVTLTVGACVLQLPLRQPGVVAKSAAFLEALAPGRIVLGVGAGEHRGEYEAAGRAAAFGRRGAMVDAGINDIREAFAAEGRYRLSPGGAVPIWVGGRSETARRRAARVGDGWVPHLCPLDWYADQLPRLDEDLLRAGRPTAAVRRAVVVAVAVDGAPGASEAENWLGRLYRVDPGKTAKLLVRGPADQVAERVAAYCEAGAEHVAVFPASDRPVEHFIEVRDAWPAT